MQPWKRPFSVSRISAGSRQLLVGPASASSLGADEGAVLDPGDVGGVGERQVGVGALGVGEALEGARRRSGPGRGSRTPRPSRRTSGRRRAGSGRRSPRPSRGALRAWSALRPRMVWLIRGTLLHWTCVRCDRRLDVGVFVEDLQRRRLSVLARRRSSTLQVERLSCSTSTSEGQLDRGDVLVQASFSRFASIASSVLVESITVSAAADRRLATAHSKPRARGPASWQCSSLLLSAGTHLRGVSQGGDTRPAQPLDRVPRR